MPEGCQKIATHAAGGLDEAMDIAKVGEVFLQLNSVLAGYAAAAVASTQAGAAVANAGA